MHHGDIKTYCTVSFINFYWTNIIPEGSRLTAITNLSSVDNKSLHKYVQEEARARGFLAIELEASFKASSLTWGKRQLATLPKCVYPVPDIMLWDDIDIGYSYSRRFSSVHSTVEGIWGWVLKPKEFLRQIYSNFKVGRSDRTSLYFAVWFKPGFVHKISPESQNTTVYRKCSVNGRKQNLGISTFPKNTASCAIVWQKELARHF